MDRHSHPLERLGRLLVWSVPLLFIGYLFVWPLGRILWRGLVPGGGVDLTPFSDVLTDSGLRSVAWFTLWQAVASTALTLTAGIPLAYVFARYDFAGKRLLHTLLTIPFVLPTVVVGTAFLAFLGPEGPLGVDLRRTVWAILAAHVFYNLAVVMRTVGATLTHLDPTMTEAARNLGASPLQTLRRVTLPLVAPSVAAATAIVFLFSFTSFGTVLILGGPRYATIEVEIYRQATALFDLGVAAALAVVQLVAVTAALAVYGRFQRRRSMPGLLTVASGRRASTPGGRAAVAVTLAGGLAVVGFPIWYLVRAALDTAGGFGFTWFARLGSHRDLIVDPAQAIGNSLLYAAVALTTTLVVGGLISIVVSRRESRSVGWFDTLVMLPLGTSAVTLGFGFIIALDRPFDLRGTWVLVPLAHALVAIPLFTRVVVPVLKSIDPLQRDAAAALGASPWQVRRLVDFPMARRAVAVGAALAIAVSLGEFGATAFVARPNAPTIPIAIFRFLSQPGAVSLGTAAAMSVVLLLVTGAVVAAVDRTGEIGTF